MPWCIAQVSALIPCPRLNSFRIFFQENGNHQSRIYLSETSTFTRNLAARGPMPGPGNSFRIFYTHQDPGQLTGAEESGEGGCSGILFM